MRRWLSAGVDTFDSSSPNARACFVEVFVRSANGGALTSHIVNKRGVMRVWTRCVADMFGCIKRAMTRFWAAVVVVVLVCCRCF